MSRSGLFLVLAGLLSVTFGGVTPAGAVSTDPLATVVSDDPVNSTPHALDGAVRAIAEIGTRVYVGGTFTTVANSARTTQYSRNYLFAFDRGTGQVIGDFTPTVNGSVETIAAGPNNTIIIGGRFTTVDGASQRSLAMLDTGGNRVSTFTARTNGYVTKVLVRSNRLLAGGRFSTANGVTRGNLAGFNASTGALDGLNLRVAVGRTKNTGAATGASVLEMDANAAGTRLVIIGNFQQVDGATRQQIAMINLDSNTLSTWSTNRFPNGATAAFECADVFDTAMRDVEFSFNGNWFAVVTTGGARDLNAVSLCDTVTRWETTATSGARETWRNCTGGDTLWSVAVTGTSVADSAVYVGGHQRWMNNCGGRDFATPTAVSREGIAALDPRTGQALAWNPGRTRGVGAEELVTTSLGLYVGSDTERLGGEFHGRLGRFPAN